jgi:hypothetical protein
MNKVDTDPIELAPAAAAGAAAAPSGAVAADRAIAVAETAPTGENLRIASRVATPRDLAFQLFSTTNYDEPIRKHIEFVRALQDNPIDWYFEARNRLKQFGPTASFPEFEGPVALLTKALFQKYSAVIEADESLKTLREIQIHSLLGVQTQGRFIWPYKATILVIEEMLRLVDVVCRKIRKGTIHKYYHNFRYRLYLTSLLDGPDALENIVFPTCFPIGSTFLIKTRCAPIMFLGVVDTYAHADQYDNSPLDFWAHDVQHSRRLIQEDKRYYDTIVKHMYYYVKRSPFDYVTKDEFNIEMYKYTQKVWNLIKPVDGDDEKTSAYKQLKKLLVFEVVHERGWPLTQFSLCRNIPYGYNIFPIEILIPSPDGKGLMAKEDKFQDPTTLANMYNKLRKGFYDKVTSPIPQIVNPKYRTARAVAEAARELMISLGCKKTYTIEKLLALTQDPKGAEEFTERAGTIDYPNNRNDSVSAAHPTEGMSYWLVEPEAPLITNSSSPFVIGGKRKTRRNKKSQRRKSMRRK